MRLAADGRGAQTVEINDKFAHFNESLSIAQEAAREAITARAREREAAARREKEVHEERLRLKAQEARLGRAGFTVDEAPVAAVGVGGGAGRGGFDSIAAGGSGGGGGRSGGGAEEDSPIKEPTPEKETKEEREERRKRDDLRCCSMINFTTDFLLFMLSLAQVRPAQGEGARVAAGGVGAQGCEEEQDNKRQRQVSCVFGMDVVDCDC